MNFNTIGIIIGREYTTKVKKKSFLITTFIVPVLMVLCMVVLGLLVSNVKEKSKTVAVVDDSAMVIPYLKNSETISFQDMSSLHIDTVKSSMSALGIDGVLKISSINADNSVDVSFTSLKPVGMGIIEEMSSYINEAVEDYRIKTYNIEGLEQIINSIESNVKISSFVLDDSGKEKISESSINSILSMVLGIIIFMFIAMFGAMVMGSVIEEKNSRVVEVLMSSVNALDLMFGKIIGVALVAITQFLLWIVFSVVLIGGAVKIISPKLLGEPDAQAIVSSLPEGASQMDAITAVLGQTDSGAAEIVGALAGLDIAGMLLAFLVYFILGYVLYASLYAAIGSAVENEGDSSQLQMPITIPLMIAYFIALYAYNAPDSSVAIWGSLIPFTSPIVMLARIPFGVPSWQIILSIALLIVTSGLGAWVSAKIYRAGILIFGKKTTFKDLWKWLKQK